MMDAGALDREIVLEFATASQSASGEEALEWTAAEPVTVWAQWLPSGTKEAWQAQQRLQATISGVFRIYWRGDIDPALTRIVWDNTTYDIQPPIEIGRREGLDIPVTAH